MAAARLKAYHRPVYICPVCNQLVPNPVKGKCPNGHGLFDGNIMASTREQPAGRAFVIAVLIGLGITALVILSRFFFPEKNVAHMMGLTLVFFIAFGVFVLLRGMKWRRTGGPVARLAPRAFGAGLGYLLTGAGLLALGFALDRL